MVEYFYIPKQYEHIILFAVDNWTKGKNGWTIITGVYKEGEFMEGDSLVYNVDVRRTKTNIQNSVILEDKTLVLIGFCLEGDLEKFASAFKKQLLELEGVLVFNNNLEVLTFLKKLNGR